MKEEKDEEELKTEETKQKGPTEDAVEEPEEADGTAEKEELTEEEHEEELPSSDEETEPALRRQVEEEILEERIYTIPLGKAWIRPSKKRAPKAMKMIKDFVKRHMKLEAGVTLEEEEEPKKLIISNEVNERVWKQGIEKPPRKVRVRAAKDKEGNITVYLAE